MERSNSFIGNIVRTARTLTKEELEQHINFAYNNSNHRRLRFSPNEMKNKRSYWDPFNRTLDVNYEEINTRVQNASKKDFLRKGRNIAHDYAPGELVLLKMQQRRKADSRYSGPYKILEVSKSKNRVKLDLGEKNQ